MRLGDVVDLLTGHPFKSAGFSTDPDDIPLLRGDNVAQRYVRWDGVKRWPSELAEELERYRLRAGDVVLAMDRPWIEAGLKVADVRADGAGALLVQRVARLRGSQMIDQGYLKWALYSPEFTSHVLSVQTGSTVPHISPAQIREFLVHLPPLDEQRRIAAVLGAFDDLIETNRALTASLELQARQAASKAPSLVELSSVARVAETRQLKPSGLVEHYSLPAFDNGATPEYVDGTLIQSNKLTVREPSVLVSRLNPRWERCWLAFPGENAVASTEFVPLLGLGVQIEELWAVTSAPAYWSQMRERVTGTTGSHQRVDKSALLDLLVPDVRRLPEPVRSGITALVRTASQMRSEIADLTRTRDELLPLLMSGRVRVEGVEGMV
ncbi:restriction endonuclease subunit S [Ornithinimicrobium panacihumi]|uniref:restriction endonuclease subunit S n=1 Tax=Ornithinimicrobium panacihumi TaxID=2008449 RepID=UPI003F8CC3E3